MRTADVLRFASGALRGYTLRTALMLAAMSVGVAAVMLLTSLGEGARRYVTGEFASLGTNLLIILPGRSETAGGGGPAMFLGQTPRDLTLDDALAVSRQPFVRRVAPLVVGSSEVSRGSRSREVPVLGTSADMLEVRHWKMAQGSFLPPSDFTLASSVCVLGAKLRDELFGSDSAIGELVRIGDRRFRVVGVLASEGSSFGMDSGESVLVPVASAQMLFNTPDLFRLLVEARSRESIPLVQQSTLALLAERHQGEKDVTVIAQDAILATFDKIFNALTLTVAGIAAISLAVAGILIMNVMLVAVAQRTAEIGLLKAIGATERQVRQVFLAEAALLSAAGSAVGVGVGWGADLIIKSLYPSVPFGAPAWAIFAAVGVALGAGLLFSVLPARRAAKLDPVAALAKR